MFSHYEVTRQHSESKKESRITAKPASGLRRALRGQTSSVGKGTMHKPMTAKNSEVRGE